MIFLQSIMFRCWPILHWTPLILASQSLQLIPALFHRESLEEVQFLVEDDGFPFGITIDPTAVGGPEGGGDGEDAGFQILYF